MLPAACAHSPARWPRVARRVGARNFAPLPRALMRPSIALADLHPLARRPHRASTCGIGSAMPDLGFGEGHGRRRLAVCFAATSAGARPYWSSRCARIELGTAPVSVPRLGSPASGPYAARNGLEIWVVTQVVVDDERSQPPRARTSDARVAGLAATQRTTPNRRGGCATFYRRTAIVAERPAACDHRCLHRGRRAGRVCSSTTPTRSSRHFATIGIDGRHGAPHRSDAARAGRRAASLGSAPPRRAELFGLLAKPGPGWRRIKTGCQQTISEERLCASRMAGSVRRPEPPSTTSVGRVTSPAA